ALNQVLAHYIQYSGNLSFGLPLGALQSIQQFVALSAGRLLMLAADKGYTSEEQLASANDLEIALHGSFSLMVNFHALRLYAENIGGFLFESPQLRPDLRVAAFVLGTSRDALAET